MNSDALASAISGIESNDTVELTLFGSNGNVLATGDIFNPGPNDAFVSYLPYVEYTATEAGTYYAGVSSYLNGGSVFAVQRIAYTLLQ
ncbi:MAG: hypothetical protein AAF703_22880 [Cyanobacteria bacterium P01_D01_bin.105]